MTCVVADTGLCDSFCLFLYCRGTERAGFECHSVRSIWIWYMQKNFCFLRHFFSGPILQDSIRQHHGTEKFMDYGFMEAMMRSKTLPATDLWYSQGKINYYYGGQYFAVFLTKAVRRKSRTHLQSDEDVCGRTCFRDAVFAGASDGD